MAVRPVVELSDSVRDCDSPKFERNPLAVNSNAVFEIVFRPNDNAHCALFEAGKIGCFLPRLANHQSCRQNRVGPAPARVYNIGNGTPVRLMDFIEASETELGVTAKKNKLPIQPGDMSAPWADCSALEPDTGDRPDTDVRDGIREFVGWYRGFYGV